MPPPVLVGQCLLPTTACFSLVSFYSPSPTKCRDCRRGGGDGGPQRWGNSSTFCFASGSKMSWAGPSVQRLAHVRLELPGVSWLEQDGYARTSFFFFELTTCPRQMNSGNCLLPHSTKQFTVSLVTLVPLLSVQIISCYPCCKIQACFCSFLSQIHLQCNPWPQVTDQRVKELRREVVQSWKLHA